MTVGATGYIHWIVLPDTPGGVPRMTAGGVIARLVPGNPDIKVSGVSRYP